MRLFVPSLLSAAAAFAWSAPGQCVPTWQSTGAQPVGGGASAQQVMSTTMWDPDGPGPQTPRLVVGGSFVVVAGLCLKLLASGYKLRS